jgi:F-type H+-transporting ATPase subunit b
VNALALALGILLLAAPALAASEDGGDGLLLPAINFVILLGALIYFTRKPIQSFFAERRRGIHDELERSAELQRQAEERYAKWQRRLVDLERELDGIRRTSRERAESERENILADARASAARIERTARAAVDRELQRAKEELREQASDLAVELAAGLLRDRVTDADRARLMDEFIARVEQAPARVVNGSES